MPSHLTFICKDSMTWKIHTYDFSHTQPFNNARNRILIRIHHPHFSFFLANTCLAPSWSCLNQHFVSTDLEVPGFIECDFNSIFVNISFSLWRFFDRPNLLLRNCASMFHKGTFSAWTSTFDCLLLTILVSFFEQCPGQPLIYYSPPDNFR